MSKEIEFENESETERLLRLVLAVKEFRAAEQSHQNANVSSQTLNDRAAAKSFARKSSAMRGMYLVLKQIEDAE